MVHSNGNNNDNGSEKPPQEDIQVFEPIFAPNDEDEQNIGWYETDVKGEEGRMISESELPQS